MKGTRRPAPRIVDPATHPQRAVCLRVAAHFLDLDERTLRARIESGVIPARRDGKVYKIAIEALVRYSEQQAQA